MKKKVLHSLHHFLTGAVLVIKGSDKISHHGVIGSLILVFGIIILAYFFFLLIKKHHSKTLGLIVHWFEALVSLFMAYILFMEGKKYLPYVFIVAAIGFFIAIFLQAKRKTTH